MGSAPSHCPVGFGAEPRSSSSLGLSQLHQSGSTGRNPHPGFQPIHQGLWPQKQQEALELRLETHLAVKSTVPGPDSKDWSMYFACRKPGFEEGQDLSPCMLLGTQNLTALRGSSFLFLLTLTYICNGPFTIQVTVPGPENEI